jgi:hypothetical protein
MPETFLDFEQLEIIKNYYINNELYFNYEYMSDELKKDDINSLFELNNFVEVCNEYENFKKQLLEKLEKDEIIVYSKRGCSSYYSLKNSKYKGYNGNEKAQKFIFENYINESFEYNRFKNIVSDDKKDIFSYTIPFSISLIHKLLN